MIPAKKKTMPVTKLEYSHLKKFQKTKKWKTKRVKTAENKNRKREERLDKKMKPCYKKKTRNR